MTWEGKRRKQLPSNWGAIRKRVLERDGYRCTATTKRSVVPVVTGFNGELGFGYQQVDGLIAPAYRCTNRANEVHHVNGPLDHSLSSLRSICAYHHNLETQAEARQAQAKARALNPPINPRLRPKTKHPGLA